MTATSGRTVGNIATRLDAVRRLKHFVAVGLEHQGVHLARVGLVVDEQHAPGARRRRCGSSPARSARRGGRATGSRT